MGTILFFHNPKSGRPRQSFVCVCVGGGGGGDVGGGGVGSGGVAIVFVTCILHGCSEADPRVSGLHSGRPKSG